VHGRDDRHIQRFAKHNRGKGGALAQVNDAWLCQRLWQDRELPWVTPGSKPPVWLNTCTLQGASSSPLPLPCFRAEVWPVPKCKFPPLAGPSVALADWHHIFWAHLPPHVAPACLAMWQVLASSSAWVLLPYMTESVRWNTTPPPPCQLHGFGQLNSWQHIATDHRLPPSDMTKKQCLLQHKATKRNYLSLLNGKGRSLVMCNHVLKLNCDTFHRNLCLWKNLTPLSRLA